MKDLIKCEFTITGYVAPIRCFSRVPHPNDRHISLRKIREKRKAVRRFNKKLLLSLSHYKRIIKQCRRCYKLTWFRDHKCFGCGGEVL